jgi:hypothetical protein
VVGKVSQPQSGIWLIFASYFNAVVNIAHLHCEITVSTDVGAKCTMQEIFEKINEADTTVETDLAIPSYDKS